MHGTLAPYARDGLATEGELVAHAAAGDRDAFDVLIRARLERLYRLSYAITRSYAEARDATQDACVLAWRELPRLRDQAKFDSWLSQIVVNAARGAVRKTARREVRELSVDVGPDAAGPVVEPSVPAESETFGEGEAIRRAFGRLDGRTRTLLVLHYVEEMPLAEIARTTGAPVGTVKWRLSSARQALARALEAERR